MLNIIVFTKNIFRCLKIAFKSSPIISSILTVLIIITGLIPLYQAKLMGDIINKISEILQTQNIINQAVILLVFLYASIYGLSIILSALKALLDKYWFTALEQKVDLMISKKRVEVDLAHYENPKFHDLLQRAMNKGIWPLINLADAQSLNISNITVIIASSVITSALNWQIYLIILLTSIPFFVVQLKYGKNTWSIWSENSSRQRLYEHLKWHTHGKTGVTQLKLMQNSKHLITKMEEILTAFRKEQISVDNKKFWSTVVAGIIGTVGYGFAFYIIVAGVSRGDISLGTMVFLVSLLGQLVGSISSLFSHIAKQFEDNLYVTDIFTFLDTKPYIKRANNPQKLNLKTPPKIEFKNVWFRYTEDMEWILKDVSMTLNPYEKLALIGENGAGKSTLIKLLARIYDPDKGDILVNDINLKEIDPDEWTSYLGILLQDFMNYNFSVGESIAMGRMEQHPPLEEVKRAATLSGADDFISDWEYKYAEQIGKEFSGKEPSKGQNQKLALARIIYRRGLVTVLDEPTASIDPMAEMNIFENMEEASKDSTLILITHRFNTVKNVDQIIVLEHGKIIETGNHKELLEKKGRYAEMYSAQAKSFMEDAE